MAQRTFIVTGMSCAACVANVERAVKKVDGVLSVSVNLLTNTMAVDGGKDSDIISAVERIGYGASLDGEIKKVVAKKDENQELKPLIKRLISSLIFLIALMYFSMGHSMLGWPVPKVIDGNHVAIGLIQLILSTIILIINRKFFINGFKGIFRGVVNMDTLVGMGSGVAYGWSVYVLFAIVVAEHNGDFARVSELSHDFYFESSAMILTLITIGKTLETYSKGKTTSALKALMSLTPPTATILRDGVEIEVGVEEVQIGDIFIVKPAESIAVDGVIIEGGTSINESALTGESIPCDKSVGNNVSAGTINLTGYIKCKATRVGKDTTLSQIVKMVSDASATKAPVARVADKVASVFVPTVIVIAIITLIVWGATSKDIGFSLARAISVLVISCPCALGLATPVAIMVGNGVGARNGILFKHSTALENLGKTEIVVLDKTGTITSGEMSVTDVIVAKDVDRISLLAHAYMLEQKSEHPLSRAITKYTQEQNLCVMQEVEDFEILPGNGLVGKVQGKEIAGGNLNFVSKKTAIPQDIKDIADSLASEGKTPLFFEMDGKLLGIIAVSDTIREDSARAINELKNMGIYTVMLTGDNSRTAKAIGELAGVNEVVSDVLPDEKAKVIVELKKHGRVAMVGDGINDAPALTIADIGIAIGAGTDVAIDAADVVLTKSTIMDVAKAIRLSKSTLNDIYQNLFWAFIYNVIGIPLAAGAWIPVTGWEMNPMFGAAAMSLSSVCVVLNALRLNLVNITSERRHKPCKLQLNEDGKLLNIAKKEINMTKQLKIEGMMCPHCEARVKKILESIDGIDSATTSFVNGTADLTLSKDVDMDIIKSAIENDGYKFIG